MEDAKILGVQPRRTLRRRGIGMLLTVSGGTMEVSCGWRPTSFITSGRSRGAKSGGKLHEKSEEVILPVDRRDNSTRQEGRTSASTTPSEAVRDGACPGGPITPVHITITPAQACPMAKRAPPVSPGLMLWQVCSGKRRVLECCGKKVVGKPYAGEPHVRFEVAGVGNVAMVEW